LEDGCRGPKLVAVSFPLQCLPCSPHGACMLRSREHPPQRSVQVICPLTWGCSHHRSGRSWEPSGPKWNQARNQIQFQTASCGIHRCTASAIWNQVEPRRNQAPKTSQMLVISMSSGHGANSLAKSEPSGTKPGTKLNFRQPRTESPLGSAAPAPFIILNKSRGGRRAAEAQRRFSIIRGWGWRLCFHG
jgi:hypothetical protein